MSDPSPSAEQFASRPPDDARDWQPTRVHVELPDGTLVPARLERTGPLVWKATLDRQVPFNPAIRIHVDQLPPRGRIELRGVLPPA